MRPLKRGWNPLKQTVAASVVSHKLEATWRTLTQRQSFSTNIWSDAYLVAFARAAGLELITFDKGFAQYKNLSCTILS